MPRATSSRRPSPGAALAWFLAFAAVLVGTFAFYVTTAPGQRLDSAALLGVQHWGLQSWWATQLLSRTSAYAAIAMGVIVVIVALLRRRFGLLAGALILVAGANVTTQVLKHAVFDRPDLGITWVADNSFPSGHTTIACALGLALILVVPPRGRPWAAFAAGAYTLAIGLAVIALGWHRPADVFGAIAVCGCWASLVLLAWGIAGRGLPAARPAQRRGGAIAAGIAGGLGLGTIALSIACLSQLPGSGPVAEANHVAAVPLTLAWIAGLAGVLALTIAACAETVLGLASPRRTSRR